MRRQTEPLPLCGTASEGCPVGAAGAPWAADRPLRFKTCRRCSRPFATCVSCDCGQSYRQLSVGLVNQLGLHVHVGVDILRRVELVQISMNSECVVELDTSKEQLLDVSKMKTAGAA